MNSSALYIQIKFKASDEIASRLMALLSEDGYTGFWEMEAFFCAYIPEKTFSEKSLLQLLETHFKSDEIPGYEITMLGNKNWNSEWEKQWERFQIGELELLAPGNTPSEGVEYPLFLRPDMTFGTGQHPTTLLMLQYLLKENLSEKNILDHGCGTGVLGIMAYLKAAASVTFIDYDRQACENTRDNLRLNGFSDDTVFQGEFSQALPGCYDILLANISRNVIMQNLPLYAKQIKKTGSLALSGFLHSDKNPIFHACEQAGFEVKQVKQLNNWVFMLAALKS